MPLLTTEPPPAQKLFDDIGERYEDAFGYHAPAHLRSINLLLSQLKPNSKVVDIGCGTGRPASEMLTNAGHDVTGTDISPRMISHASHAVTGSKFVVADSRSWQPAPEDVGQYDAVIAYFSFLVGMSQQDIRDFFARAFRWVRPGGSFVFGTVRVDLEHGEVEWLGRKFAASSLDRGQVQEAVSKAGFVVEKVEEEGFKPKGGAAGLCEEEAEQEEMHLFVHARKPS